MNRPLKIFFWITIAVWVVCAVGTFQISRADNESETVTAYVIEPRDPYRNLPCEEGPHTVYDFLLVPCEADPWFKSNIEIDGKEMCAVWEPEEWTDWPRCEGRKLTAVELHVREVTK